jgi:hypothetical protein
MMAMELRTGETSVEGRLKALAPGTGQFALAWHMMTGDERAGSAGVRRRMTGDIQAKIKTKEPFETGCALHRTRNGMTCFRI